MLSSFHVLLFWWLGDNQQNWRSGLFWCASVTIFCFTLFCWHSFPMYCIMHIKFSIESSLHTAMVAVIRSKNRCCALTGPHCSIGYSMQDRLVSCTLENFLFEYFLLSSESSCTRELCSFKNCHSFLFLSRGGLISLEFWVQMGQQDYTATMKEFWDCCPAHT